MAAAEEETLHATAVAHGGWAVLIVGASGSGKSGLALDLMARGAVLVADDRVILRKREAGVHAFCPEALCGMIEARGVGILRAEYRDDMPVALVVDLDREEAARLPPRRATVLLGIKVPLIHKVASAHFPAAILQYLSGGGPAEAGPR